MGTSITMALKVVLQVIYGARKRLALADLSPAFALTARLGGSRGHPPKKTELRRSELIPS